MSEWITDRLPTEADTEADADENGYVWVITSKGDVWIMPWECVTVGMPWMPISMPKPYVKAKWVAENAKYSRYHDSTDWRVRNTKTGLLLNLAMDTEEQAGKFVDFLNEVMP